ncbi:MAG: YceH family protein [Gemmatimonadaceae bacterium]
MRRLAVCHLQHDIQQHDDTPMSLLSQTLEPVQVRVLAALIEKELSTPDHYPLSLNALTSACNQSSNREPVMLLDEGAVADAVDVLRRLGLVRSFQSIGSRVPKYQHLVADKAELTRPELAVLCVLALRGPQTRSEVRTRAARLLPGDNPDSIEAALEALIDRKPAPAATPLPRRLGQKEVRYSQTLSGEVPDVVDDVGVQLPPAATADRIAELEKAMDGLRSEVADLRAQLAEFQKQFE